MFYEQKKWSNNYWKFIVINSILIACLVLFNSKEQLVGLVENSSSSVSENAGEMKIIHNGVAAIGGLAILYQTCCLHTIANNNFDISNIGVF